MFRLPATAHAILAGLTLTLLQLILAVLLLAPEGPLDYRYQTLIQHDSYWFANVVDRGYQTIVPPMAHKMMEVSNVAFFPAYPLLTAAIRFTFGTSTENALLIAAQSAAWGFWTYFFLFCSRWNLPRSWQWFGALSIAAHPGAFFLIAAYSESLFLMALFGFLYWTGAESRRGRVMAAFHGMIMSATRIVGLPCALAPLAQRAWKWGWRGIVNVRDWLKNYGGAVALSTASMLGGFAFFLYCQLRWGHWNTYMLTQQLGWAIEPDYFAIFRPSSYRWLMPALANPTEMSQMAMTIGGLMLLGMAVAELLPAAALGSARVPRAQSDILSDGRSSNRERTRQARIAIYFAALVIYFISVSGVACVQMESMLRYEFCVHALIVLALLHYLHNVPLRSWVARSGAAAAVALISAVGLGIEGWYIWNFTRGNWVA